MSRNGFYPRRIAVEQHVIAAEYLLSSLVLQGSHVQQCYVIRRASRFSPLFRESKSLP